MVKFAIIQKDLSEDSRFSFERIAPFERNVRLFIQGVPLLSPDVVRLKPVEVSPCQCIRWLVGCYAKTRCDLRALKFTNAQYLLPAIVFFEHYYLERADAVITTHAVFVTVPDSNLSKIQLLAFEVQ